MLVLDVIREFVKAFLQASSHHSHGLYTWIVGNLLKLVANKFIMVPYQEEGWSTDLCILNEALLISQHKLSEMLLN